MIVDAQKSYQIERLISNFGSYKAMAARILELEETIEIQKDLIKKQRMDRERMEETIREKIGEVINWKKKATGK
jgi:hypothetical protein